MIPTHFYHTRKSTQPRYSYAPPGDFTVNLLLRNKPYWRQAGLSSEEHLEYIQLMIEDEESRSHFQVYKETLNSPAAYRIYSAHHKEKLEHRLIQVINAFHDDTSLQNHLFSNASLLSMLESDVTYYSELIKAANKKFSQLDIVLLVTVAHSLSQLTKDTILWRPILLSSTQKQLKTLNSLFTSVDAGNNELTRSKLVDLYYFFHTQVPTDEAIWNSLLLNATPKHIKKMHQWLTRYKQTNTALFLNLVYSKTYQCNFDNKQSKESDFIADTNQLLMQSTLGMFDFSKSVFNVARARIIHHLEKKTFVVPSSSTQKGLWTEEKNSSLLNVIYFLYSLFMSHNKQNKDALLLVAKELSAVPNVSRAVPIRPKLKSDLNGVLNNYLGSFWIRTQRKNSARTLLRTINKRSGIDYKEVLNSIHTARNEVFTNDTEKERHMHRYGSSRYYLTLNELEELLINNWVQEKNAIGDFKEYLIHYKSTLDHSKLCLTNAIYHENTAHSKDYDADTPLEKLPGYIRALKREVQLREQSYQKYEQLLPETTVHVHGCSI